MPQSDTLITRSSIINDFISVVMDPARNTSRWYAGNIPTNTSRVWTGGAIVTVAAYSIINQTPLATQDSLMANPRTSDIVNLNPDWVTASEIVSTLRTFAKNTSVIRRIQMGIYYTIYDRSTGVDSSIPSDNPTAHIGGRIDGTSYGAHPNGIDYCHLTSSYIIDNSGVSSDRPSRDNTISAPNLNSYIQNLRNAANAGVNGSSIVDLRICHSSCHSNCHSSRGRR